MESPGQHSDQAIIVALGSSLAGDYPSVQALLEAALAALEAGGVKTVARSSWWRSAAWPDPADPPFLNGVALVRTSLDPETLIRRLHRIEAQFGRVRDQANGPRTLDLDLIAYGRLVRDEAGLVLPHPRAAERLFVMGPLAQIAPDWRHPVYRETAAALAGRASVGLDAAPLSATASTPGS
jgi:2-amino-4-hydroxy-6-hydroxymethyldihydropteridine diphosphokinase